MKKKNQKIILIQVKDGQCSMDCEGLASYEVIGLLEAYLTSMKSLWIETEQRGESKTQEVEP